MTLMKSKSGITLGLWHYSRQFCKNMYDLTVSTLLYQLEISLLEQLIDSLLKLQDEWINH